VVNYLRYKSGFWLPDEKPPYGWEIDWQHPLAQGLAFSIEFLEGAGEPIDIVHHTGGTPNGSPTWIHHPMGLCVDIDGSDYFSFPHHPNYNLTGHITLIWSGIIDTGSACHHFMGKHTSNGSSNNPFDFRTNSDASPKLVLVRAPASSLDYAIWEGPSIPPGNHHVVAVSQQEVINSSLTFYVNGEPSSGSCIQGTASVATGNTESLRIGRRADGAVQMDGKVFFARGYNRILTADEHRWVVAEPYAMFRPKKAPALYSVATPTTTISLSTQSLTLTQHIAQALSNAVVVAFPTQSLTLTQHALSFVGGSVNQTIQLSTLSLNLTQNAASVVVDYTAALSSLSLMLAQHAPTIHADCNLALSLVGTLTLAIQAVTASQVTTAKLGRFDFTGKRASASFTGKRAGASYTGKRARATFYVEEQ